MEMDVGIAWLGVIFPGSDRAEFAMPFGPGA